MSAQSILDTLPSFFVDPLTKYPPANERELSALLSLPPATPRRLGSGHTLRLPRTTSRTRQHPARTTGSPFDRVPPIRSCR